MERIQKVHKRPVSLEDLEKRIDEVMRKRGLIGKGIPRKRLDILKFLHLLLLEPVEK